MIDTRDLYKRKCDLESLRDAVTEARDELAEHTEEETPDTEWAERKDELEEVLADAAEQFGTDEEAELEELEELESEISDFMHGETMIPKRKFKEYAYDLAHEVCEIPDGWPCNCIDWEHAAEELEQDYTVVTYQGDDYYVRSV